MRRETLSGFDRWVRSVAVVLKICSVLMSSCTSRYSPRTVVNNLSTDMTATLDVFIVRHWLLVVWEEACRGDDVQ